jgi:hypothetical protein
VVNFLSATLNCQQLMGLDRDLDGVLNGDE